MKTLSHILKALLGLSLIAYMFYSGKLNITSILGIKHHPYLIAGAFFIILVAIMTTYYRWKILLAGQGIYGRDKEFIPLFFIGLFFSSILPGVVSGDIIKSAYIIKKTPDKKAAAVLTIILDRIIGLIGLMIICCVGFAANINTVNQHPALKTLAVIMALTLVALLIFAMIGLSRRIGQTKVFNFMLNKVPFSKIVTNLYEAFHTYRDRRRLLLHALIISIFNHTLCIIGFFMITRALGFKLLDPKFYLFIVPTGMLTSAIPITPSGIGIGQAAFLKLFEWALGVKNTIGADAATIWQAMSISIYMVGVYFYATYRRTLKE